MRDALEGSLSETLQAEAGAFLFVFLLEIGARHEWRVDGVEREVGKERAVLVRGDKFSCLGGEAVGEVFAVGTVGKAGVVVGREIFFPAVGAAFVDAAEVVVEALVFRPPASGAEVPFAGEEGGVAGGLEGFRERGRGEGEAIGVGRGAKLGVAFPVGWLRGADVVGDAGALGPLAGEDAGARGRADGARGVGIGELRAVAGEAIKVGRFVERAAVGAEVLATEVVGEEKDDVGGACGGRGRRGRGGSVGGRGGGEGRSDGENEGKGEREKRAGCGHGIFRGERGARTQGGEGWGRRGGW